MEVFFGRLNSAMRKETGQRRHRVLRSILYSCFIVDKRIKYYRIQ